MGTRCTTDAYGLQFRLNRPIAILSEACVGSGISLQGTPTDFAGKHLRWGAIAFEIGVVLEIRDDARRKSYLITRHGRIGTLKSE